MELSHKQRQNIGFGFVLDEMRPNSAWGRQLLKELVPFGPRQKKKIERELDNIEKTLRCWDEFGKEYKRLEHLFMQVKDIRTSIRKCRGGVLGEVDLFEVKRYLIQLAEILPLFKKINGKARYAGIGFKDTRVALALLDPDRSGIATFHISDRWSAALAAVRREKKDVEAQLRENTDARARKKLEAKRRDIVAREQDEEEEVRHSLSRQLEEFVDPLLENADAIARLDVTIQKARLVMVHGGVKPQLGTPGVVLRAMRNPMMATRLEAEDKEFTPVDISLAPGSTVITGANMGGKSVTLKTLALNLYLAQCGFYAFAQECQTPLFAKLFMVSEDQEDAGRGLSSFGGEIVRFNEIDQGLGPVPSLVLLDEFGRGTNPQEGAAIAQSVCQYLNGKADYAVMTTHFDHVYNYAGAHYEVIGLKNTDIKALAKKVKAAPLESRVSLISRQMDYGLVRVESEAKMPHDAVNICRLLGLNDNILGEIEKKLLTFDSEPVK